MEALIKVLKVMLAVVVLAIFPVLETSVFILLTAKFGAFNTFIFVSIITILEMGLALSYFYSVRNLLIQQPNKPHSTEEFNLCFLVFVLLLIPGFLTDILALALIFPTTKKFIVEKYQAHSNRLSEKAKAYAQTNSAKKRNKQPKNKPESDSQEWLN